MGDQSLEESMKIINLIWSFSLVVLGICMMILVGTNLLFIELPVFIIRGVGLIDLAALSIFAYTTVRKMKNKL